MASNSWIDSSAHVPASRPQFDLRPLSTGEVLGIWTFQLYRLRFSLFAGLAILPAAVSVVTQALGSGTGAPECARAFRGESLQGADHYGAAYGRFVGDLAGALWDYASGDDVDRFGGVPGRAGDDQDGVSDGHEALVPLHADRASAHRAGFWLPVLLFAFGLGLQFARGDRRAQMSRRALCILSRSSAWPTRYGLTSACPWRFRRQ